MSAPAGTSADDRLDSWKEIASYLGREVRTVQGWEKSEGLPVHRHQHARQGSVYAFKSELDAWRDARRGIPEAAAAPPAPAPRVFDRAILARLGAVAALLVLGIAAALWVTAHRTPAGGIPSSVVVLPFLDLSPEKDQEYFSDGLTEELIDALTRVPNLRVVARTSSFAFKGKALDVRRIGEQLNVTAVLEGSVRKSGDQLRITAQLARVSDGYHLWSQTYDRNLRGVFAVQREISQEIADHLRAGDVPRRKQPRDVEAWRLFQEGRFLFNKFEPPDSDLKAIERYQQAIARDPTFAQAYAGMADAYSYLAENFVSPPREMMPKAREAAEKALQLDDSSADAHVSLGIVKLDYDRDREGAQREFVRAMQLNSGNGYARHWYAHSLEAQGRLAEAMPEMRKALELDPLSIPIRWDIGGELIADGRAPEAIEFVKQATELFPNVPTFTFLLAEAYEHGGDKEAARRSIETVRTAHPELKDDPMFMTLFGVEAAFAGRTADARAALRKLEDVRRSRYVDAFLVLSLCTALHDRAESIRWLRRADEERSTMFVYLPMLKSSYGVDDGMLAEIGVK